MTTQRVPLATGATAFRSIFVSVLGAVVLGAATGQVMKTAHAVDDAVVLGIGTAGLFGFCYGVLSIIGAVRGRATDLDLSAEGFAVVGGPWEHELRPWSTIDSTTIHLDKHCLTLAGETIAEAYAPAEEEALGEIARALIAASTPRTAIPTNTPAAPAQNPAAAIAVVYCASCGASAVPVDAEEAPCRECGSPVHFPAALRDRIRAAREIDKDTAEIERLAKTLSRHASAVRTNRFLLVSGLLFLSSVSLASFGLVMGWPSAILAAVAFSLPMLMFARLDIADRTGAVLLASGSGARAPEKPGDPYGCRVCGAPLPAAEPGAIVVRCGYCNASSVLGIDLRIEAGAARWQEGSFAIAAGHRRRGEIWRAVSFIVAAVLLLAAWKVRGVIEP